MNGQARRTRLQDLGRFLLLIAPFLALASMGVGAKELLGLHHFRQAHTAMTARNFAFHDWNILHPTIDGVTYGKDIFLNEFPLYPFLVGALWKVFGEHLFLARVLALLFGILALWYYRRLLLRLVPDELLVDLAVVIMSLSPVVLYFFRTVQRQSLFVCMLLFGTYHVIAYVQERGTRDIVLGAIGLSLATLLNPFVVYMALPMGWLVLRRDGLLALRHWPFWALALLAVVPSVLWYTYALTVGQSLPTGSINAIVDKTNSRDFLSFDHYSFLLAAENWYKLRSAIGRLVLPHITSVGLCIYGLISALVGRKHGFFVAWLLAVGLYFALDFYPIAVVVHHYYYLNIAPLTAFFCALGLVTIGRQAREILALNPPLPRGDVQGGQPVGRESPHAAKILAGSGAGEPATAGEGQSEASSFSIPMLVVATGLALFACFAGLEYAELRRGRLHGHYYQIQGTVFRHLEDGARLTVLAQERCPLLPYLLGEQRDKRQAGISYRVVPYHERNLTWVLRKRDFDYLLVVWNKKGSHIERELQEGRAVEYLGPPIARGPFSYLFRKSTGGSVPGG